MSSPTSTGVAVSSTSGLVTMTTADTTAVSQQHDQPSESMTTVPHEEPTISALENQSAITASERQGEPVSLEHTETYGGDLELQQTIQDQKYRDEPHEYGRGARARVYTEEGLQYDRQIKATNLRNATRQWRRLTNHIESHLTTIQDESSLMQERASLVRIMEEIYNISDSLAALYPYGEFSFPEIEDIERNHADILRRINNRLTEIVQETRSQASRKSKASSQRSIRSTKSLRMEAAAKAAELETELTYLKSVQEREAAIQEQKAGLKRLKLEKELSVTKARLQVVSEEEQVEDYGSMLAGLPTDTDRVQQYRRENAMTPPPSTPAVTTTPEQQTGYATMGVMTSARISAPMQLTAATQYPNVMASATVATTSTVRPAYGVATSITNMPAHTAVVTSGYTGPPPIIPETGFATSHVSAAPQMASREFSTLNPNAQGYVPQVSHESAPTTNTSNSMTDLIEQMYLCRVPTPEPPVFSGDPLEYAGWKSAFEALIDQRRIPATEKMYYLKKYISGKARECIEGYFLYTSGSTYEEAKAVLDKRFGDVFVLQNAFREKLERFPKISPRDSVGLRRFADFLRQCLAASRVIPSMNALNDIRENKRMQEKLPEWLVRRWARVVADHKRFGGFPSFENFVDFVSDEADIACDPCVISQNEKSTKEAKSSRTRRQTFATASKVEENKSDEPRGKQQKNSSAATSEPQPTKRKWPCVVCKGDHRLDNCEEFKQLPLSKRRQIAKKKALCFNCLVPKHMSKNCRNESRCKICKEKHATLLHMDATKNKDEEQQSANVKMTEVKTEESPSAVSNKAHVHLAVEGGTKTSMILPVYISHEDNPDKEELIYAMLDQQSDTTFLLDSVCEQLDVSGIETHLSLSTMSANNEKISTKKVMNLRVRGYTSKEKIKLPPAYTRPAVPVNRGHIPTTETAKQWPYLAQIADKVAPLLPVDVGILIGYDCTEALNPLQTIAAQDHGPFAQKTKLGWGIVGGSCQQGNSDRLVTCHRALTDEGNAVIVNRLRGKEAISPDDISRLLNQDFTCVEPDDCKQSLEDRRFLETLENGIKRTSNGHLEMPLPFKMNNPTIPDNKQVAIRRLMLLKKRLKRDKQYHDDYTKFMDEIISRGYAEEVPQGSDSPDGKVSYIPHHGVYHPKKPNKIRVVFDCSSTFNGVSINDLLLQGPDLINGLVGVLCRFRKEHIAVCCDVEKMFFQFGVTPEHRDFLRFIWWRNGDIETEPIVYRMTVHLFGAVSSPGCANFGLKKVADLGEDNYGTEATRFVKDDFYVDDGLASVPTVNDAIHLVQNTKQLCAEYGIRLHRFASNSQEVLETIPQDERAKCLENIVFGSSDYSDAIERVLGIEWHIASDSFRFKIKIRERPITRRGILSAVGQIYDPLGFLSPVILIGRQVLQDACKKQLDWDAPLPEALKQRWERWKRQLQDLEKLAIKRCFKPEDFGTVASVQLHHFSDASSVGYGQCSYIRLVNDRGEIHVSLVCAKARVAPVKQITIPRLELTAAVLATKVSKFLQKELKYGPVEEFYWTDSEVVLAYISSDAKRFHVFVANRIQKIRDRSTPDQWYHIKSVDNPADLASRGMEPSQLLTSDLWFKGPAMLWKEGFSTRRDVPEVPRDNPELKKVARSCTSTAISCVTSRWAYFSTWSRLRKAVAHCRIYMMKLLFRVKAKLDNTLQTPKQNVDVHDLRKAELTIIKTIQQEAFPEEIAALETASEHEYGVKKASPLFTLNPILDDQGILRVGGRLEKADECTALKHPVILPHKSHVTYLIARHYHEVAHQGRGITINEIQQAGYWICGVRRLVRCVINSCVTCRKCRRPLERQKMAPLPKDRVEETPPFTYCGVDYFGPFYIRQKRSDVPRYGVIFTCLMSRAIHLEVADTLDTDSFINALRRFIAIRGPIRQLRCDRGSNFVGAKNELTREYEAMNQEKIKQYLQEKNCDYFEFKFNVPHASHMGGVWERQIRTVRNVLQPMLMKSGSHLDDESLRTLFCEVMSIVNSRPLTVDTLNDETSPVPLTPNYLLTAKTSIVLPPPPAKFQETDLYLRKRWRRVQYLLNVFWTRWRAEYLQSLQCMSKWNYPRRDMKVGDIVITKDDSVTRNHWPLAIVEEVLPSSDGRVRKVKLRMSDNSLDNKGRRQKAVSYLERPIHKLVLLMESADRGIPPPRSH